MASFMVRFKSTVVYLVVDNFSEIFISSSSSCSFIKTMTNRIVTLGTRSMAIANGTCVSFCNQPKAHFDLPWDNRGKCYMDGKRIQCLSKHHSMYPSVFNRLRAIARYWSEIATFSYPLHLTPPLGCSHWNSGKSLVLRKLESWCYQAVKTV